MRQAGGPLRRREQRPQLGHLGLLPGTRFDTSYVPERLADLISGSCVLGVPSADERPDEPGRGLRFVLGGNGWWR